MGAADEERSTLSVGGVWQPKRVNDVDYIVQAGAAAEQRGCLAFEAMGIPRQWRDVVRADRGRLISGSRDGRPCVAARGGTGRPRL
jgi:hypothetical protein